MAIAFDFRSELAGEWDTARGYLIEGLDRLYAGLSILQPILSIASLPASSVFVTDTASVPAFSNTLPKGLAFGQRLASATRLDGSVIQPIGYNTQATSTPSATTNQLAHSFFVTTSLDIPGSSSQVLEGYNYYSASGTTPIILANVGNAEHGGTGTATNLRAMQAGTLISNTGGGTDAVNYHAAPAGRVFGGTGTFTNGIAFFVASFGAGYTNHYALYSADATAGIFLASDIAAKSTTNTWQVTSDARTKRDVRPFTDGLDVIAGLRPVHFTYNGIGDTRDGDEGIGVIAQEAQSVAPYIVKSRQASDGETYKMIDTGDLTWVLVNAVQELTERIARLEPQL